MKIIPSPLPRGEKGSEPLPVLGKELPPSLSPLVKQNPLYNSPTDFLSRILINLPQRGEVLNRLSRLPLSERFQALTVLLTLAERDIILSQEEWMELWTLVRKKSSPFPSGEEEVRQLFPRSEYGKGEELLVGKQQDKMVPLLPLNQEGRRGQIALSSDKGSDNLFIRMETSLRHWEFHLVKTRQNGGKSLLDVFTNDQGLIDKPPREWDTFRKKMIKNSISVERKLKFLRKPLFLTENVRRELEHLVDIVL